VGGQLDGEPAGVGVGEQVHGAHGGLSDAVGPDAFAGIIPGAGLAVAGGAGVPGSAVPPGVPSQSGVGAQSEQSCFTSPDAVQVQSTLAPTSSTVTGVPALNG